jgi:hypothetical protein
MPNFNYIVSPQKHWKDHSFPIDVKRQVYREKVLEMIICHYCVQEHINVINIATFTEDLNQ